MSEQLSLLGLGDAPPPTDRLFFALFPKADTAARIARQAQVFCDEHGLKGKPLLTLKDTADYIHGIKSKNPLSEAVQPEGKEDWK